jgi:hypothetical protein
MQSYRYLPIYQMKVLRALNVGVSETQRMDEIQILKNFLNYWEKIFFLMEGKTGCILFNF